MSSRNCNRHGLLPETLRRRGEGERRSGSFERYEQNVTPLPPQLKHFLPTLFWGVLAITRRVLSHTLTFDIKHLLFHWSKVHTVGRYLSLPLTGLRPFLLAPSIRVR